MTATQAPAARYNLTAHMEQVGLRMGKLNAACRVTLAVGDHVTNLYGGAAEFLGRVVGIDGEQVEVEWLSQHIGPNATRKHPRSHLVYVGYSQPRRQLALHRSHNGAAMRWMLHALSHLWHVGGVPGSASTAMSPGYDGSACAQMWGHRVEIRYNSDTGQITWARRIGRRANGEAYAVVIGGEGAGHAAMMWLVGDPRR